MFSRPVLGLIEEMIFSTVEVVGYFLSFNAAESFLSKDSP
jgi:hypothetical protein